MYRFTTRVYMDFGATFSDTWTDVTPDVLTRDPIVVSIGRRYSGPGDVVPDPGTMTFTLNNSATNSADLPGYYSPHHSACRAGFGLRTPVQFGIDSPTFPVPGFVPIPRFKGRIIDVVVEPGRHGTRATRVTVGDLFANLAETPVRGLSVQVNKKADELIDEIFLNTNDPDYNTLYTVGASNGVYIFPTAFDSIENERTTILEELKRIALSERGRVYSNGGTGMSFLSFPFAAGSITSSGVPVVVGSLNDDMVDLTLRSTSDDLVQSVNVTVHPTWFGATDTVVLYSLGSSTTLVHPGEINTFLFGPYRDESVTNNSISYVGGTDFQTVTATTDYTMNAAEDGSGADLTGSFTVVASTTGRGVAWTITNTGTTSGYVTKLQLRGRPIYRTDTTVFADTGTTYGTRVLTVDMPYQTDINVAQELAAEYAGELSRPGQPKAASVRFDASRTTTLADHAVLRAQSDIIAITETQTGLSQNEYRIIGQKWESYPRGLVFCTWYLEAVNMATWITPSYSSANFESVNSVGTITGVWDVASGDVLTYRYTISNRTMTVAWLIQNTDVTSTTAAVLRFAIPEGRAANYNLVVPCLASDAGGAITTAYAQLGTADGHISVHKLSGNWTQTFSNNTSVYGEITFETSF